MKFKISTAAILNAIIVVAVTYLIAIIYVWLFA
jgi:hypothetical protein